MILSLIDIKEKILMIFSKISSKRMFLEMIFLKILIFLIWAILGMEEELRCLLVHQHKLCKFFFRKIFLEKISIIFFLRNFFYFFRNGKRMTVTRKVESKGDGSKRVTETIQHPDGRVETKTYNKLGHDGKNGNSNDGNMRMAYGHDDDDMGGWDMDDAFDSDW